MANSEINYTAAKKMQLYKIARELFNKGLSHPQIVQKFTESNCNKELAELVTDKAFHEKWDKLFDMAKSSYGQGKTYSEVIELLRNYEEDDAIVKHVTDAWYEVKTLEMESIVESPTNIFEGLKWVIISAVGIPIVFLLQLSLFSKIIWMLVFIGAAIQYLWGLRQKSLAKQIKKFMENEENK